MRNALYSRAKVSRFNIAEVLPFPNRLPENLVQTQGLGPAD